MNITLYTNKSDKRVVDKTLVTVATKSCTIKGDCDLYSPSFELAWFADLPKVNYIYVPDWGRYYFVSEINMQQQKATIVCSKCDVLMSFSSEIRLMRGVVCRQEKNYNMYLNDKFFKVRGYTQNVPQQWPQQPLTKSLELVFAVAGRRV